MNRAFKVARLQLANKWTLIGIPLVILAAGILVSLAIFTFIPGGSEKFSGAGQAPLWYFFAVGIQSLTLTFPFSQGLSVSRRAYYIGTVGLVLVLTLLWGVLYYLLGLLEDATNGWGVQGHLFHFPWVSDGPWYRTVLFFWIATMFLFFIGFWSATLYKRWRATGLLVAGIAVAALLVAIIVVVNLSNGWIAVGSWFAAQTSLSIGGYVAIIVALLGIGSFLTLRRTTP
ncbi:hypothetical protein [Spelaeicoccus albus]|uniref:Uncharacterized protein n=1 Tax=Spelaeicoccus albus TaxID=1280376 RepID=A0A7Z0D107_9MICO|nr:hypothetical protein [Spelaeicoccus albus]NYI66143.1 hypothetical protein [Spelaeicoccus albus]